MKNRFYGDKKDYIKYGLLDVMSTKYKSIGINWYLTDDRHGNQNHGNDIGYLNDPKWKDYNSNIFSLLKKRVENNQRHIKYCAKDGVFSLKHEVIEQLPDNETQPLYQTKRTQWHYRAKDKLAECDLVFYDPDIGVIDQLPNSPIKASE